MIVTLKACPFCGKNDLIIKGDAENYEGIADSGDSVGW